MTLADLWLRDLAPTRAAFFELQRGAPIPWSSLKPCGPARYAESSLDQATFSGNPTLRTVLGPWWIIRICAGIDEPISVAVSSSDTGLRVVKDRIVFPKNRGLTHFVPRAIPIDPVQAKVFSISLDEATAELEARIGRTIAAEATLVTLPRSSPQLARWRFSLSMPVQIMRGGQTTTESVDELYVGYHPKQPGVVVSVAAISQPSSVQIFAGQPANTSRILSVSRKPGLAVSTDPVTIVRTAS